MKSQFSAGRGGYSLGPGGSLDLGLVSLILSFLKFHPCVPHTAHMVYLCRQVHVCSAHFATGREAGRWGRGGGGVRGRFSHVHTCVELAVIAKAGEQCWPSVTRW